MEMARIAHGLKGSIVSAAALAALAGGCGKVICPDGMALDKQRSKPGETAFCQSAADPTRALWIELRSDGERSQRRQMCPFLGGRPGGPYLAFHANGSRWLEGRYEAGHKVGRWTQWSPDGRKIAEGQYRDGQLIEGAPVGFPATCESVTW